MKPLLLLALLPTLAFADDVTFTRQEARKDGSEWKYSWNVHLTHVFLRVQRTKSPPGLYVMARDKEDQWNLNDANAFDAAIAALAKVPIGKRPDVKAKEWVELCLGDRCAKRAAGDKGGKDDAALDKVQWELMNHTTLDSL